MTNKKIAPILLGTGLSIALMICVISITVYGRVYFFDGYDITKFAWVASAGCIVSSIIAYASESKGWIVGLAVTLLIALVVTSSGDSSTRSSSSTGSNSGDYRCNNCGGDGWDSANGCSCVWCGGDGRTSWNP